MVMHPHEYAKVKDAGGVRPTDTEPVDCVGAATDTHGPRGPAIDPRVFGLVKAAYSVNETLSLLSIGRTSLYKLVARGDLKRAKFGKKTLIFGCDIAALLTKLKGDASHVRR
jgi:hypothetical protein